MIKGQGTFLIRTTTAKGRKYDTYYIYIPTDVATDGLCPFKPGEKVQITIDAQNHRFVIEKENHHNITSSRSYSS